MLSSAINPRMRKLCAGRRCWTAVRRRTRRDVRQGMGDFESSALPGATARPQPRRLSAVFEHLSHNAEGAVSVGEIRTALGDRSFAAFLVLFAFLNLLPLPPGATLVFGVPMMIVAAQMIYGSGTVWLPRFFLKKSVPAAQFRAAMERIIPRLIWVERFIRPRYWPFWRKQDDRVVGLISFVLATAVTLPIPFGNWLPACSVALVGLALSERDGVLLLIGAILGLISLVVIGLVIGSAGALLGMVWGSTFGAM
jgi:hypothetical protein